MINKYQKTSFGLLLNVSKLYWRNYFFQKTVIRGTLMLLTFAQSPSEGYVRYDADGMARSVMNLDVKQFTGTDAEIANQYLVANKSWICGGENGNYLHTFGVLKCHRAFTLSTANTAAYSI